MPKSTVSDTIIMVENTLIQHGTFHLPGKKALLAKENAGRTLVVDVTESPIERPRAYKKLEWIHLFVLFCSISGVIEIIMAFLRREKVAKLAQLVPKLGDTS